MESRKDKTRKRRKDGQELGPGVFYLFSAGFVCGHVTLQLCAVAEGVGA